MGKTKLTKNELKRQKDLLRRYQRYLPTLLLKKQQLQIELRKVSESLRDREKAFKARRAQIDEWVAVLAEEVGLAQLISIEKVEASQTNIAGVDIPVFRAVRFAPVNYDLFAKPLWVDAAVMVLRELIQLQEEIRILNEQHNLLRAELTVTSQRVNLFEKVKIPQAKEGIRTIQIYLGDQQTAAVVRGKISKNKLIQKAAMQE